MKKWAIKICVSVVVLAMCVGGILVSRLIIGSGHDDPLSIKSHRVKGNPRADVRIVEYADFRCGHCRYGALWLKKFMRDNPEKLYLEYRYYPLNVRDGAFPSRFAECALRQGKFWEVYDELMARQREWMRLVNPVDFFLDIAQNEGMGLDNLTACWEDPAVYEDIIAVKHAGRELGVKATPTYFINGKMIVGNAGMQKEVLALLGIKGEENIK